MKTIRLLSWNVNGIRAIYRKGMLDWLRQDSPDILCLQETKAHEEQLPEELIAVEGYHSYFSSAERKGYSGVGLYTRERPESILTGFGVEEFDREGRTIIAVYRDFILFNIYFPNGCSSRERLIYKLDFYDAFLDYLNRIHNPEKRIIICGDFNTAHTGKDLINPQDNEHTSGFLPIERAWIDSLIIHGFVDTFRLFTEEDGHYTWWDYKIRARERNVGWRLDYVFASRAMVNHVVEAFIMPDIPGSDHCPAGITMEF